MKKLILVLLFLFIYIQIFPLQSKKNLVKVDIIGKSGVKSYFINFSNERLSRKIPFSSPLSYEEISTGYTEEELGISYQDLENETNAITDIGTLLTYLIDLIFLFKEPKNYIKYLIEKSYLSEIHAKEFIVYEKNIIENLSSK